MAQTFMIYGPTGSGKTTTIFEMAKWVYETTGRTTRVISCDLGGVTPIAREGLIKAKIVSVHNAAGDNPKLLNSLRKLSRGWWLGRTVKQVPVIDDSGLDTGETKQEEVIELVENKEKLKTIGLYYIEGASSMSDSLMRHLVKQEVQAEDGKVQAIGPQGASGRYEEDGEVLGGNSKGHFNIVQVEMHGLFSAFSALPDHMLAGWTAHEGMGLIKRSGESCYAPQLAGGAKNHLVPSWVGDCFHLSDIPEIRNDSGEVIQAKEVRAYYIDHVDNDSSISYKCKSRVGPSDVPKLRERFPGGYIPIGIGKGQGLDQYFRWLEERKGSNLEGLLKWKTTIDQLRQK